MERPRLGFMAITCPTHAEANVETGAQWVDRATTERALAGLQGLDVELIRYERMVYSVEDAMAAVKAFKAAEVDGAIFFIQTWNWAAQLLQAAQQFDKPIMLWAVPISHLWSIGGLAVTKGSFDEVGLPYASAYGMPEDPAVLKKMTLFGRAAHAKAVLARSRYGSIGGVGMGIHTGIIDANQWLSQFGILVGYSDQYQAVVEAEQVSHEVVQATYRQLTEEYASLPPLDQIMERSIRLYHGMERVIAKEGYDFTGVKCTFDLSDNYCAACLCQSRLSTRGFVSACLNDANGALTMYIMRQLTDEPLFMADVNLVDKARGLVKLIDDGSGSRRLAGSAGAKLDYQPRIESKASGICTSMICKPGRVTLARLARISGQYVMQIAPGEAIEGDVAWVEECGYPMWPHAFVRLDGDLDSFVDSLRAEYIHLAYGDLTEDLVATCQWLGVEPIVVR